ncbi:hypothetical protein [Candidatus Accumulibacter cognatus]|uniref:Uncharacterized protein n=1 Tax=Candidatus Accumulibacter cognatus TaxID=2954383 RepID=A0A080M418_9PROT|nr:hypothetical protein [Candidatus Accumulibacter cognatus]KFB75796.1 MAG: hypothetical protein AW06_003178 [Candidatus Accumulibacter cognatus]
MTPTDALVELFERLGENDGAVAFVSDHELSQWPDAAVTTMKRHCLLTKSRPAASAVCPGCERDCVMPVDTLPATTNATSAFIVCDKRSDINRVAVSADRLAQWQCSVDAVVAFVAAALGLRRSTSPADAAALRVIGMASGNKRVQVLCLRLAGELALVAGGNEVPLADLIEYRDGAYLLDEKRVRLLVDAATPADPRYTPSNARREARKLDTQAMYKDWQKAYRDLARKRPAMADTWYAQQIARTAIAKGRDADTIRKKMKL